MDLNTSIDYVSSLSEKDLKHLIGYLDRMSLDATWYGTPTLTLIEYHKHKHKKTLGQIRKEFIEEEKINYVQIKL